MWINPDKTWPVGEWAGWRRGGQGNVQPVCVLNRTVKRDKLIVRKRTGQAANVSQAHLDFKHCVICGEECPGGLLAGALCSVCHEAKYQSLKWHPE